MKYNPRACNSLAMLPELMNRHPCAPARHSQGTMTIFYELQEMLKEVTGMAGVSLTPMAGAQGELAGIAMIRASANKHLACDCGSLHLLDRLCISLNALLKEAI
jgi:glycine cleavage system protein P-like pyridoxal-binding family